MHIDYEKIVEIYGEEYLELIKDNINEINLNLRYMKELGFTDIIDIFERVCPIFICDNISFKNKLSQLIKEISSDNYVEIIENDIGLLEALE